MPADVNKTIEIQMKADLAQLKKNLAQIPNMTKEEAAKTYMAPQAIPQGERDKYLDDPDILNRSRQDSPEDK